jgi:copper chaperone CopZ
MKNHKLIYRYFTSAFLTGILLIYGCNSRPGKALQPGELLKTEVSIGGMTCTGCEQTIMKSVGKMEGIASVTASFASGKALVEFYPSVTDTAKIRGAITGSGYTVTGFSKIDTINATPR